MRLFRRSVLCALLIISPVVVCCLVCGCSGDDSSSRFQQLLKLIPSEYKDSPEPLVLTDLASYYEDFEISLTGADGKPITLKEYVDLVREKEIRIVLGGSSHITGWGRYAESGLGQDSYVGYDFTMLDAEITTGQSPVNIVGGIGRYDAESTRDALSHQGEWPSWAVDAYTTEEYRGVTIHSWGDGFEMHMTDRLAPPAIDELGRARPLAVTNEYLFSAPRVEAIKSMIDASQGRTESLADLPEFAAIAQGLDELNAYTALIGYETLANGDPELTGTYPGPRLKKFVTFGSGLGEDSQGTYMALAIYHENPDNARSNVSLLEQRIAGTNSIIGDDMPWSELITDTEIRADGDLLLAKLYTDSLSAWVVIPYGRDILLLHET
jgi:hypothetical protein